MSKMNELSQAIDELLACGQGITHAALALKNYFSGDESVKEEESVKNEEVTKTYTFLDVRQAFSKKSQDGFTKQVKDLIKEYGVEKLSEIGETEYPSLMQKLEAIQ